MSKKKTNFFILGLLLIITIGLILYSADSVNEKLRQRKLNSYCAPLAIQAFLASVPTWAMTSYDEHGSYINLCETIEENSRRSYSDYGTDYDCDDSETAWAVESRDRNYYDCEIYDFFYCIDSTGKGVGSQEFSKGADSISCN